MVGLNKTELAHFLKVSLPTLTRWLLRWPDFPVVDRGTNGKEWEFDPEAVATFLRGRQEEEALARENRDQTLAQLALPMDLGGAPPRNSAKEELDAWRVRRIQREEAERAGRLVPAAAVADAVRMVLARIGQDTARFLRQVAREQSWPEAYLRDVEKRLRESQRATVTALDQVFGEDGGELLRDAG
ncbi:MAG: terminase small subunit [Rhodospirillales bacterium]|nr:terminase small subunit [Rhodospirillales bacterium]